MSSEKTTLEGWIFDLLDDIKKAAEKGENFDLHLESPVVAEIANAYEHATWIEIY